MPIKIEYKTEQEVRDIKMTGLVSYSDVMNETYRLIKEKNLKLIGAAFKPNANGDTVTATYIIDSGLNDPDLEMAISWTHSYHKAIRFQCNASAVSSDNILVIRDLANTDKSRRSSDSHKYMVEIFEDLKLEINFIQSSFNKLLEFKNKLKEEKANIGAASVALGILYCEEDILTTSQIAVIKEQIKSSVIENAWDMYLCFGEGLKDSHPKLLLFDHIRVQKFFEEVFILDSTESAQEKLSLPSRSGKTVNEEIEDKYFYVSDMPSVIYL